MSKTSAQKLWERCLAYVRANVSEDDYGKWFAPMVFNSLNMENKMLVLSVPSHAIYETLENETRFKHLMYNIIWTVYKEKLRITYCILVDSAHNMTTNVEGTSGSTPEERVNTRTKKVGQVEESELDSGLNENYTFDNFIEGAGNKLLRSVGMSIASNPKQTTFNPLFIYGSPGVGKTHLATAIGIELKRNFPSRRVLYVTSNLFKVQYTSAVQKNRVNDFIGFYQTIDVLIIDDIQELAGLAATQQTFFHIFNHLRMLGRQIIMTSDRQPASMVGMEERLLTRFKWGLTAELEKPDHELCLKILQDKIRRNGLTIEESVVEYIANHVKNSIRDLEGVLSSLMAHALVYNHDIDMAMAQRVVNKAMSTPKRTITIEMIMDKACNYFDVSESEIISKGRKANVVVVRQLIMYLASRYANMTSGKIGLRMGNRTHATVIHAIKQVESQIADDKDFAKKVEELTGILGM